jgi:hypothetical protein
VSQLLSSFCDCGDGPRRFCEFSAGFKAGAVIGKFPAPVIFQEAIMADAQTTVFLAGAGVPVEQPKKRKLISLRGNRSQPGRVFSVN